MAHVIDLLIHSLVILLAVFAYAWLADNGPLAGKI